MTLRAVLSSRSPTGARLRGPGRCFAALLLTLLAVVPATADPATPWSVGVTATDLSASNDFASTGTAGRSTPETRAFASAEVDGTELFGLDLGFRASRFLGLKLGWMPGGDLPMAFRAVCDPCEVLTTDPLTGEDNVTIITRGDNTFETDLEADFAILDVSLFPPLSRRSSSAGRRFELFLGPTLAHLDPSLQRIEGLNGVDLDAEIENNLGAHLGLELRATSSWTIHATARWFPTEIALDYRPNLGGSAPGEDPRPLSELAINAPLGSSKSDWILISLGTSWRF